MGMGMGMRMRIDDDVDDDGSDRALVMVDIQGLLAVPHAVDVVQSLDGDQGALLRGKLNCAATGEGASGIPLHGQLQQLSIATEQGAQFALPIFAIETTSVTSLGILAIVSLFMFRGSIVAIPSRSYSPSAIRSTRGAVA